MRISQRAKCVAMRSAIGSRIRIRFFVILNSYLRRLLPLMLRGIYLGVLWIGLYNAFGVASTIATAVSCICFYLSISEAVYKCASIHYILFVRPCLASDTSRILWSRNVGWDEDWLLWRVLIADRHSACTCIASRLTRPRVLTRHFFRSSPWLQYFFPTLLLIAHNIVTTQHTIALPNRIARTTRS